MQTWVCGEQHSGDNNGEQYNGDHNSVSASGWAVVRCIRRFENQSQWHKHRIIIIIAVAVAAGTAATRQTSPNIVKHRRTSPLNAKQPQECINSRHVALPNTHHRHGQAPDTAAKPLPTCATHRVFLSMLLVSRVDTTLPMIQSTSARASPNGPRRVVFLNWHPAYCMCG
jgi:hypothetical protein